MRRATRAVNLRGGPVGDAVDLRRGPVGDLVGCLMCCPRRVFNLRTN